MKIFSILALSLCFFSPCYSADETVDPISINMVYMADYNLPSITAQGIKEIVRSAQDEFNRKFGTNDFKFIFLGEKPVNFFFKNNLKTRDPYYQELSRKKLKFFSKKIDYQPYQEEVVRFLKQWKLWDLKNFFPKETQDKINTYEDLLPFLYEEYAAKVRILENLKQKNRKFLIDRRFNLQNSYVNWKAAMYFQKDYDIVICNTIIMYDDFTQPYPHAVLRYAKVGGSSFLSPHRPAFDGTSAMINLFEMLTDIPYFKVNYNKKKMPKNIWNDLLGRYIMAHEMGHMIYLIPDVYNHPEGCLMDSSVQNLDYYDGYQILIKYPVKCPKCEPYVQARLHHFKADQLFKKNDFENACYEYKLTKKMTPEDIDGSYASYMSLLNFKMAKCQIKLKNNELAESYLTEAIKLDPENKEAKALLNSMKK
ncbi:MAG: hypothetical protein PHF84_08580 [bacterium]|nr:hypothetical protein [bacterium]